MGSEEISNSLSNQTEQVQSALLSEKNSMNVKQFIYTEEQDQQSDKQLIQMLTEPIQIKSHILKKYEKNAYINKQNSNPNRKSRRQREKTLKPIQITNQSNQYTLNSLQNIDNTIYQENYCQHKDVATNELQMFSIPEFISSQQQVQQMVKYLPSKLQKPITWKQQTILWLFSKNFKKQFKGSLLLVEKQKENGQDPCNILITSKYVVNLTKKAEIFLGSCRRYFDSCNFMFGQAQVYITKQGVLRICRKNKICKLKGDLLDGQYQIQTVYHLIY